MRFASFLVAGILALTASAQTTTESVTTTEFTTTSTSTTTSVQTTDSAQASVSRCLSDCDPTDVDCRADCIGVPSPDETAVNKTRECSDACPQGNGTKAETDAYAKCLQDCVNKYYFSSGVGTPTATDSAAANGNSASASASATITAIVSTITSSGSTFTTTRSSTVKSSSTGKASPSSTSASSSSAGNAGDVTFRPGNSYVGLIGAIAAMLAL